MSNVLSTHDPGKHLCGNAESAARQSPAQDTITDQLLSLEFKRKEAILAAPPFVSREAASSLYDAALRRGKLLDPFLDRPGTYFELKPFSGETYSCRILANEAFLRAYNISSICTATEANKLSLKVWQELLKDPNARETLQHIFRHEIKRFTAILYPKARRYSSWQDVLQDVRVALDQLWQNFNPEKGALISFVRDRIKHRVFDSWRTQSSLSRANQEKKRALEKRQTELFSGEVEDDRQLKAAISLASPFSISSEKNLDIATRSSSDPSVALQVEELLDRLPPKEAKALQLTYLDGRSGKESASILGVSSSAFSLIKQAALDQVRLNKVAEKLGDEERYLDFSVFEREMIHIPDRTPTFSSFAPYLKGIQSIADLFQSRLAEVCHFRSILFGSSRLRAVDKHTNEGKKVAFYAIRKDFPTIDDLKKGPVLCRLLGLNPRLAGMSEIVKKCLDLGIYSAQRPVFQVSVNSSQRQSFYFDASLVGEKIARSNLIAAAREVFPALHDVKSEISSFRIFCMHFCKEGNFSVKALQKELASLGWSQSLPEQLTRLRARHMVYFDKMVLDQATVDRNKVTALRRFYPNLHKVKASGVFSAAFHNLLFGSEKRLTVTELQTLLVKEKILSARLPRGCFRLSLEYACYFKREIAGPLVEPNLRRYFRNNIKNLDNLRASDRILARALGLEFEKNAPDGRTLAREAIKMALVSPHLPPAHFFSQDRIVSFYFESQIVGEEIALSNLHQYLRGEISSLDDISSTRTPLKAICERLGIPSRATALAHYMVKKKLVSSTIPDGHSGSHLGKGVTFYLNPTVIKNSAIIKANLGKLIRQTCPNLDQILISRDLWQPLGLGTTREEVVTTIAKNKLLDLTIPHEHPLANGRVVSFYISPKVVGLQTARDNLSRWIADNKEMLLANISRPPQALGRALNMTRLNKEMEVKIPGAKQEYLKALAERGILLGTVII
jgi:RNA polymerase sigma factor (sigma-70 family)